MVTAVFYAYARIFTRLLRVPSRSKQERASLDAEVSTLREAHRSQQRALEDAATERTSLVHRIEELQQRVNRLSAERETSEKKYLKQVLSTQELHLHHLHLHLLPFD